MIANDEGTDIVSNLDINENKCWYTKCITLNQMECGDFFTNKEDRLKSITSEEEKNKKRRNTMGRIVSGRVRSLELYDRNTCTTSTCIVIFPPKKFNSMITIFFSQR